MVPERGYATTQLTLTSADLKLMGSEFFNSNDIENWNYVRATNATGGYEALSVIFDYPDRVQEVIDRRL